MIETGQASDAYIAKTEEQRRNMWEIRESAAEITVDRTPAVDTDVAVPLDRVDRFLEQATERLFTLDPQAETMTVCHLGDGNLHFTAWPTSDDPELLDSIREMDRRCNSGIGGQFFCGTWYRPNKARVHVQTEGYRRIVSDEAA